MDERCEFLQRVAWKKPDLSLLSGHVADKQRSLIGNPAQGPTCQRHHKTRNPRRKDEIQGKVEQERRHNADSDPVLLQKPEQERKLCAKVSCFQ